jgi:hypothetical protein
MKNVLNTLVKREDCRKLHATTNTYLINGNTGYIFYHYIYAAGGSLLNHWLQCLSLLTERGFRLSNAPTSSFFIKKSNEQ